MKGEYCETCGTFVEGFEYKGCCSGRDCGCLGLPIELCFCSENCYNNYGKDKLNINVKQTNDILLVDK